MKFRVAAPLPAPPSHALRLIPPHIGFRRGFVKKHAWIIHRTLQWAIGTQARPTDISTDSWLTSKLTSLSENSVSRLGVQEGNLLDLGGSVVFSDFGCGGKGLGKGKEGFLSPR